jgi:uncharacterized protein
MLKVILDTNVIVSAMVFGGKLENILEKGLKKHYQLVFDGYLEKEVLRILIQKFGANLELIQKVRQVFANSMFYKTDSNCNYTIFQNTILSILQKRDPKDVYLLELVLQSKSQVLVTEDKDLLFLKDEVKSEFLILKPSEFLELI